MTEERIIDVNGWNGVDEIWTIIPSDVIKDNDKVTFKMEGLTCKIIANPSRFVENGDGTVKLLNSTLTEDGSDLSFLLDSLVQFKSDKVLSYKKQDKDGNWKEEPLNEE